MTQLDHIIIASFIMAGACYVRDKRLLHFLWFFSGMIIATLKVFAQ